MFNAKLSLSSLFSHTRAESESAQFGRDARADWQVVVYVFLVLNVFSIGMSVFIYQHIDTGEIFLVDKKEPVSIRTVNRFELEQTVRFFEEKQARFDALKRWEFSTADPYVPKVVPTR